MLDLLARKCLGGDILVSLANLHLENHEWGEAKICIERAFEKGDLIDFERAVKLLNDINGRLGVNPDGNASHRSNELASDSITTELALRLPRKPHIAHTSLHQSA